MKCGQVHRRPWIRNSCSQGINGASGLASLQTHRSDLIASPPYAGILDGIMDELGYKSLGKLRMMKSATMDLMKAFDE